MNMHIKIKNIPRLVYDNMVFGVLYLYNVCIAPQSKDEDASRHEFILNVILISSIIVTGLLDGFIIGSWLLHGDQYRGVNVLLFSAIVLTFGTLLYLSRRGYFYYASYVLVAIYFASSTYGMLKWGVELPLANFGFVITIIFSSILIGTRFAFLSTLFIALMIISLGYFQVHNITSPGLYWKNELISIKDPIEFSIILLLIMTASWLSNREIDRSLKKARSSELELKKERDMLEIKIEERTKELKLMQADKMAQLYRFAEFGRLSSGLFHDLMKPLNALIIHMESLEHSKDKLPEAKSYLTKAVASSRRMGDLLNTIKKQVRSDTIDQTFSIDKEVEEAIDILAYYAREKNVSFKTRLRECSTFGNPLKLHQIAVNLIANAIDACANAPKEKNLVTISLYEKRKTIEFSVADNGGGINEHIKHKIFDPFFTTKQTQGVGLGLSTTKDIVEKDFGGEITVKSTEGLGSTFTVSFPKRESSEIF